MNKTKFIAVALLLFSGCYALAMPSWEDEENFKQWVKSTNNIKIEKINNHIINVPINDQSTVHDIKMSLQETQDIDVDRQSLLPLLALEHGTRIVPGPRLDNHENIKRVMNYWDTANFLLVIQTENQQQSTD